MNTAQQMGTMTGQNDRQDMLNSDDPDGGVGSDPGYGDDSKVMLDKSVPEIADAFQNCKPGDMYKVESDDENEIVLSKQPAEGGDEDKMEPDEADGSGEPDAEDASMPKSDNPAVALIIARKNKR
jgi:hypothetical protein